MSVVRLNLVRRPHFCRLAMSWMGHTANFLHHGSSWTYVLPSISKLSESTTGTEHMYDPKAQRKYLYLYIRWWRYLRYTHLTSKSCLLHTLCQVLRSPIQIWPKWLMYIVRSTRFCRLPELIEWCCRTHCTQQCQFFLLLGFWFWIDKNRDVWISISLKLHSAMDESVGLSIRDSFRLDISKFESSYKLQPQQMVGKLWSALGPKLQQKSCWSSLSFILRYIQLQLNWMHSDQ